MGDVRGGDAQDTGGDGENMRIVELEGKLMNLQEENDALREQVRLLLMIPVFQRHHNKF